MRDRAREPGLCFSCRSRSRLSVPSWSRLPVSRTRFRLSRIDRIFMLDRKDVRELEGKPHVMLDDQPVGLVEASVVLELPARELRCSSSGCRL